MYGSVEAVRLITGVTETELSDDAIETLIETADEIIEGLTGKKFSITSTTEKLNGTEDNFILVSNIPLISLSSISIDDSEDEVTDFVIYPDGRICYKNTYDLFVSGNQNIEVTYTHGDTNHAKIVIRLSNLLASKMISGQLAQSKGKGIKSERLGEYSITLASDSPELFSKNAEGGIGAGTNELSILMRVLGISVPMCVSE